MVLLTRLHDKAIYTMQHPLITMLCALIAGLLISLALAVREVGKASRIDQAIEQEFADLSDGDES